MARLPHRCVMISVCLAGTLLLLPLCWGGEYHYDYDSTQTPDYDDYNSTFGFYSNVSHEVIEKILMDGGIDSGGETETETDGSVHEQKPTEPTIRNQASRSSPVCFLLTSVLLVHQLLRLL
ncbi:uncharacterized protein si:ch211-191i18.2 [Megalobrama amblycephala]|uniref:uncharacterized protein si:ch211-191i18.2 n=1 Tax=Megalobrama amblycephala TaxID=75352 RepID=UPI0020143F97|nr:uncharacterized protein si:ch211-191i18.2 [Megalobrama amblycephala]